MRIVTELIAGIVCAALVGGAAHAAEDTLKPGKWQVVAETQGPKMPPPPPGTKLPPGVQLRPDGTGMTMTRTTCVSAKNPVPVGPPPAGAQGPGKPNCKTDRIERNGGDVRWAATCTGPQGTMQADGEAHYTGDTMDATIRSHASVSNGQPVDTTQHITAKYLGPCTGK